MSEGRRFGGLGKKDKGIKGKKKSPRHKQQYGDYQEGKRWEVEDSKEEYMVIEWDLTWDGEHTIQYTDDVL